MTSGAHIAPAVRSRQATGADQASTVLVKRSVKGFTVVELLAVTAVIAVLASLLWAALARSKTAAQRIRCVGNLRQLGLAGQLYWDDHSGNAFRYRGATTGNGDLYWFGWLERGEEGKRKFDLTQGALFPYLGGRGVEICPSLIYQLERFKLKARGAAYGYGYNLHLSAPASGPALQISAIPRPSEIVFLADAGQVNTFQPPASLQNPLLEEFYYVNATEATTHFRHRQRANSVFCDAHVDWERPVAGSLDRRLPSLTIGRLRPSILLP